MAGGALCRYTYLDAPIVREDCTPVTPDWAACLESDEMRKNGYIGPDSLAAAAMVRTMRAKLASAWVGNSLCDWDLMRGAIDLPGSLARLLLTHWAKSLSTSQ